MSQKEIKSIYESLVESEEFEIMFPDLTGSWEEDKKEFERRYNQNLDILEDDFGAYFDDDSLM